MNLIKQFKEFRKARKATNLRAGILSNREIKALADERKVLLISLEKEPLMASAITNRLAAINETLSDSDWAVNELKNL